ncbi:MAG: hypothetical protein AAFY02_04765 [Pseudomonadota bacterium]
MVQVWRVAMGVALLVALSGCLKPVAVGSTAEVSALQGFTVSGADAFTRTMKPLTMACGAQEINLNYSSAARAAANDAWKLWSEARGVTAGSLTYQDVLIEPHCHTVSLGSGYCATNVELVVEMRGQGATQASQQVVALSRAVGSGEAECGGQTQTSLDTALEQALLEMVSGFAQPGATPLAN